MQKPRRRPISQLSHRHTRPGAAALLLLLGGYLLVRTTLGALLNPPLNGPDEAAHVEYVRTMVESGGRSITGVENRQPRLYYALAVVPWQLTEGQPLAVRLFWMRLLSALAGAGTLAIAWLAARSMWPGRPLLATAVTATASLVPGYLFLLASVNNDPLAATWSSLALLAALRITSQKGWRFSARWLAMWLAASALALATKLTAFPVVLGSAGAILYSTRRSLLGSGWGRAAALFLTLLAVAAYAVLLTRHPTSSMAASYAHFWPSALIRAPLAYIRTGGLTESFRTFWHAYDYGVRWPPALEAALAAPSVLLLLLAAVGLFRSWRTVPLVVWMVASSQVALVVIRYGFGDLLGIEMGGAAQAKAFFPAIVALALLLVAGLASLGGRVGRVPDRWLAGVLLTWLVAVDAVSLSLVLWHHYRWWQIGL